MDGEQQFWIMVWGWVVLVVSIFLGALLVSDLTTNSHAEAMKDAGMSDRAIICERITEKEQSMCAVWMQSEYE